MENKTKTTARRKSAARTTPSTIRRQPATSPEPPAMPGTISARCIRELLTALWCRLKSDDGIFILLVAVALLLIFSGHDDNGATTACAALLVGSSGGSHVTGEPLTTELAAEASPELLRNEIDSRIVKLRPMATPIDQLSRWAGARNSGSMVVDYYSVDTKPAETTLKLAYDHDPDCEEEYQQETILTMNDRMLEPTETVLVPEVEVTRPDGRKEALVLYVTARDPKGEGVRVMAVNGPASGECKSIIPDMAAGTRLVRMGRAAGELDVQTAQFEALPRKDRNYCQIFKAQVEQSTLMRAANKEVGWTFSDQEEVAIYDMRLGLEKSFLFGSKARFTDPDRNTEIFCTGGIWAQAGNETTYTKGALTPEKWVAIMRTAFTGNGGASRKILIGGSGLIEAINTMEAVKVIGASDVVTKWGLDFHEIHSKFGTLYVLHSEVFDMCGHADDGMIIDPEYLTKYSHVPFNTTRLDLRTSGQRNTEAVVITEASCLVLRYPAAHTRIICEA